MLAIAKVEYEVSVDAARGSVAVRVPVPVPLTPARALTPGLALVGERATATGRRRSVLGPGRGACSDPLQGARIRAEWQRSFHGDTELDRCMAGCPSWRGREWHSVRITDTTKEARRSCIQVSLHGSE